MEYMSLKIWEICLLEKFLVAMMNHAPIGFLCILGIQYRIGSVFCISNNLYNLHFNLLIHHTLIPCPIVPVPFNITLT